MVALNASAPPRWRVPWLLVPPVLLAHLWLADRWAPETFGLGDAPSRIVHMDVAFVHELAPAAPPAVAPRAQQRSAEAPAASASQPAIGETPEPAAATAPLPAPVEPPPQADAAAAASPAAVAAAEAAASASAATTSVTPPAPVASAASAQAFEWPPSTRLSYRLTGNYRGPVDGQARVDWLTSGGRYQVHLEVSVGPSFAPLAARRLSSEGEVTPRGLVPRRYEEETRLPFREPRRVAVVFEPDGVRLADGRQVPRPDGVQDTASQFVQMTWLFTTRAELLAPGRSVEIPLALPRRLEPWTYDVLAAEALATPMGAVPTLHVRPRREARPGGDLTAEFWVAPTLQYLPVRIVIRQDAESYLDLLLERLPQQAQR